MTAIAVAIAVRDIRAAAVVNGTGSVAHTAGIQCTDAIIYVVADAIGIRIGRAVSSAIANGIQLVAVAVAIAVRDVRAAAVINGARSVAHATGIQCTDAIIDVVANAIGICIGRAGSSADIQGIKLVSIAVAITRRNV